MSLIERLFPAVSLEEFRSTYWLHRPLHAVGSLSRLPELAESPLFKDIRSALAMRCHEFRVDIPDQNGKQRVTHQMNVSREEAFHALDRGNTIFMGRVEEDPLPHFSNLLAAELDLPLYLEYYLLERLWVAFAARPSQGLHWHWDKHHLILVQVIGKKRFKIAENQFFPSPSVPPVQYDGWRKGMMPWLVGALGATRIEPQDLPVQHEEIVLSPGDVLFMPAGTWHSAETLEDSLHLAYAVKVPTLPELLISHLQLMNEVSAARFHVPVGSVADLMSLAKSDDHSMDPLHVARRAWFSAMSRVMAHYASGDHFANFVQQIGAEVERGTFSYDLRDEV